MKNLCIEFFAQFEKQADKVAIQTEHKQYTYQDIQSIVLSIVQNLSQYELNTGDRVAIQVEKTPEALFTYLACLLLDLIVVPLNPKYKKSEISYFIQDAKPKLFIHDPGHLQWIEEIKADLDVDFSAIALDAQGCSTLIGNNTAKISLNALSSEHCSDNTAVIIYTSGTTGRPKGAMLSHGALYSNAKALIDAWGINSTDRLLHCLPIFHVHGLFFACHTSFLTGASMFFLPTFDAEKVIAHLPDATLFMGVPTYYTRLLSHPNFNATVCSNMRLFISGSAPLLPATFDAFKERTHHTILERYGMSETGINTSNLLEGMRKVGSVGLPIEGVTLRIVDDEGVEVSNGEVGHVELKSPHLFQGYWQMPDKTAADFTKDGYFKTGDQGRIDEDGYLSLVGRAKDMVISGGLNIYPKEIETTIDSIDGVTESAAIGVPHADFGEALVAVVVGKASEDAIIATIKQYHANYKVPKAVVFIDALLKNTMGKVQKNKLREAYNNLFM